MTYIPRLVDGVLAELFESFPAVMLLGARGTGKTTTALRHARTLVRLDSPAESSIFESDPDAALRNLDEPVLLDEWQVVPSVLGAVKRSVDGHFTPARFLLTGSASAPLEVTPWPGTGRIVNVVMTGLSVRERLGDIDSPAFVDRIAAGTLPRLGRRDDTEDIAGYLELALQGGFPEALSFPERDRRRWLGGYVDDVVHRDAKAADRPRDPNRLRRYLEAYSLVSAGLATDATLLRAAGIDRRTGLAYESLLRRLFLVESVPAWRTNRLKRLVVTPKRMLVDPSLFTGVLGVLTADVRRDGDLLGRVLETFVAAQLRAESEVSDLRPLVHHLRQSDGRREIDFVVELRGGEFIAIEVKSDAAPRPDAARHLVWLRDSLGDRFVAGLVLHSGQWTFEVAERIVATPISSLWRSD